MTLNREELLKLARESDMLTKDFVVVATRNISDFADRLERFASLVLSAAQEEREPVAWMWEYIGKDPMAHLLRPCARSFHEMDPHNNPHKDHWKPVAPLYLAPFSSNQACNEAELIEQVKDALPEFCQQDDYLLAHGASLMSEDSHEIIHVDTLRKIIRSLKRPLQAQEQASQVGNFGDSSNAQLARRLESVPLPDYRQEPNIVDFHNGDASMWVEDGKVKAEWIRREPSASGAVSADANVDSQHSPVTDELPQFSQQEKERYTQWAEVFYRHADSFTKRDHVIGWNAWITALSRAQAAQQAQPVSDEQIVAFASEYGGWEPSIYDGPMQYHTGQPGLIKLVRALLSQSAAPVSEQPAAQTAVRKWIRRNPSAPGWYETKREMDGVEITLWWDGNVWEASPNSPRHSHMYEDRSHRPIVAPSPQGGDK